ncbi:hypothetical protein B0J11DRAFT_318441 [Dendryphion nanum]|uniref:DUF6594 domain-containing protein n=1 Tax=Dendryphion nanum TaxID=256645 RepID=A0A9P9DRC2_9PLEO|nr:hypothetical protein B0J11DRAFT_318441 [Dendryphion nanum]
MDLPSGDVSIDMLDSINPSIKQLCQELVKHEYTFRAIAKHPEMGIYRRFGQECAFYLSHLEREVSRVHEDNKAFVRKVASGEEQGVPEEVTRTMFNQKMIDGAGTIRDYFNFYKLCRTMALGPPPSRFFMQKLYKDHMKPDSDRFRAPNGLDASCYNMGYDFAAVEYVAYNNPDLDLDPIESLLAYRLTAPFFKYVIFPIKDYLECLLGRSRGSSDIEETISEGSIRMIARLLIGVLATVLLTTAVATLNNFADTTTTILVMALFCLVFASSAQFLGQGSIPMHNLIATFFQTMIFFISRDR